MTAAPTVAEGMADEGVIFLTIICIPVHTDVVTIVRRMAKHWFFFGKTLQCFQSVVFV